MKKILTLAALMAAAATASAHTGHGTHGLSEGLSHPLAADHLLAMLAVGLWSAAAFRGAARALAPATFLAAMVLGALAGAAGVAPALTEAGVAASVAVFGAMLLAGSALPRGLGLGVVAAAAALHGLAHGAELPAAGSFAAYAAGFGLSTALLHAAGLGLGEALRGARRAVWQALGSALGIAGLALLAARL